MEEKKTNVELFKEITKNMADLYEKKNANYGNSFTHNWDLLGPIAGLVPLVNKIDRLRSLIFFGHNHFESIEDTVQDLANYSVMFLIELKMRKDKPLSPLPEDVLDGLIEDVKRMLRPKSELGNAKELIAKIDHIAQDNTARIYVRDESDNIKITAHQKPIK